MLDGRFKLSASLEGVAEAEVVGWEEGGGGLEIRSESGWSGRGLDVEGAFGPVLAEGRNPSETAFTAKS